jgi:hypothetical protein
VVGLATLSPRAPMSCVHLVRVTVDAATGALEILEYAAIQDVGRALDPMELMGQIQGGSLQSLGRVLGEALVHDDADLRRPARRGAVGPGPLRSKRCRRAARDPRARGGGQRHRGSHWPEAAPPACVS